MNLRYVSWWHTDLQFSNAHLKGYFSSWFKNTNWSTAGNTFHNSFHNNLGYCRQGLYKTLDYSLEATIHAWTSPQRSLTRQHQLTRHGCVCGGLWCAPEWQLRLSQTFSSSPSWQQSFLLCTDKPTVYSTENFY